MRAYISGPMDSYGDPTENREVFRRAAKQLRRNGWHVLSPVELDEEAPPPAGMSWHQSRRFFMKRDLNVIIDEMWAEFGDTLFTLHNWVFSSGAKSEVATAQSLGIKVKMYVEER